MSWWLWLAAGAAAGSAIGAAAALWAARRTWLAARRLSVRTRGYEHLVELGQLAGGLAHEIKNPLSTINLNLKLLSEDIERHKDDEHQRWQRRLRNVQDEAGRLKGILDDFLRFAGKYELQTSPTDLRRLVSELVDFFAPQATAAKVVMRSSVSDRPVRCNVDGNLIKQAMLNLMINAVHAMPEGGELLLKVYPLRDEGVIEVIDTGVGIPPENLSKVFQVYYSTKARGTGLGLPTTKRIIREHDGHIQVESEPGRGTRFTIKIPMAAQ